MAQRHWMRYLVLGGLAAFLVCVEVFYKFYTHDVQQGDVSPQLFLEWKAVLYMSSPIEALILRYNPIFVFHEEERDFPVSVGEYLLHAGIAEFDASDRLVRVIHPGPLNQRLLAEFSSTITDWGGLSLFLRDSAPIRRMRLNPRTPVYVNYYTQNGNLYINYILLYFNNPGKLGPLQIGLHVSDFEHCTIELSQPGFVPQRFYYGAHGTQDGRWVAWNQVPKTAAVPGDLVERPLAYVTRGGHGNYPVEGHVFRFYGFGNDVTSDKGPRLLGLPALVSGYDLTINVPTAFDEFVNGIYLHPGVDLQTDNRFLQWQAPFGEGSVRNINTQGWWQNITGNGDSAAPRTILSNVQYNALLWSLIALLILIIVYAFYRAARIRHKLLLQRIALLKIECGQVVEPELLRETIVVRSAPPIVPGAPGGVPGSDTDSLSVPLL